MSISALLYSTIKQFTYISVLGLLPNKIVALLPLFNFHVWETNRVVFYFKYTFVCCTFYGKITLKLCVRITSQALLETSR